MSLDKLRSDDELRTDSGATEAKVTDNQVLMALQDTNRYLRGILLILDELAETNIILNEDTREL